MKYFKFKRFKKDINGGICTLDFKKDAQNREDSKVTIEIYHAEDPFTLNNVVVLSGDTTETNEIIADQEPEIELTEIKKTEFEKLKTESVTYKLDQKILENHKELYCKEIDSNRAINTLIFPPFCLSSNACAQNSECLIRDKSRFKRRKKYELSVALILGKSPHSLLPHYPLGCRHKETGFSCCT